MNPLKSLWRKLTHTKALENSSGKLEMLFFEPVYRVVYITGHSSSEQHLLYHLYSYFVKVMIALLVCGEMYYFTQPHSMDEVIAAINASLIQLLSLYRYKNMMDNKNIYTKLATSMESPYFDMTTTTRKRLVEAYWKENEKYVKLLLAIGNTALTTWVIYPLVDEVEYNLVVGIRLPFDYCTPGLYIFAYILVAVAFIQIAHFVMVTDVIMQAHLIHLLSQFAVLADCFENILVDCQEGFEGIHKNYLIYNKNFAERYKKRLGNLVEQHKLILKKWKWLELEKRVIKCLTHTHTMNLRNTLSRPMLGQLASSSTLICFIGYQIITTITDNYAQGIMSLFYLGYNAFELYIICRWCEEITIKSQKIGEAIYFSGWERGMSTLPGVGATVKLIIARARKPLVFTAGGMYQLSLSSFATLMKTSYSALTVLLRFRH